MSHNELLPLFPSALHPAIPVATQILSTLRGLTAPGRGNDLRPEERAALVGVAALLGCEKVQSKDLLQSSAQKACSVSPAHFRSALAHSRRLLRTVDLPDLTSPSRRSSRASSSNTSPIQAKDTAATTQDQADTSLPVSVPNPFNTPKKKYKYSSGLDISDLIRSSPRSKHEPAMSSPLRHDITPSKRSAPAASTREQEKDDNATPTNGTDEVAGPSGDVGGLSTPSKRIKYATRPGVDLEKAEVPPVMSSSRKKREDASAFFALRPGADGTSSTPRASLRSSGRIPVEDGLPDVYTPTARRKRDEGQKQPRRRRRRDWTYSETVWGSSRESDKHVVLSSLEALPAWLEANGRVLTPAAGSLEDVLLQNVPVEA